MGLTASLGTRELRVEPGGSATLEVTLVNNGLAVEALRLQVTGPGAPFSFVVPDTLTLEPGASDQARIGFRLPRTSVPPAGPLPFQVRAAGATESVVAEGIVQVAPYSQLSTTLDPPEASGNGPSRHQFTVSNRGNSPVPVAVTASGSDGLDVRVTPSSLVAAPDVPGTVTVEVTPPKRPFRGADRHLSFTVTATPELGTPVESGGRLVQRAAVATRTLVTSGVAAGAVVLALVLGVTAFSGGDSSTSNAPAEANPAVSLAPASCPAEGHRDTYANGLRPDAIPTLPNTYSFFQIKADGCNPLRFNPCEPIHYVQNLALAPPTGAADVREAFRRLGEATGMTFVDDGTTDETARRGRPFFPDRYGQRWAPVLVLWTHFGDQGADPTIQAVGRGIGTREGEILVSGQLSLNVDAVTDKEARTPVEGGYGPPLGTGTGAIGAKGVTWGRIILHELAHVVGLGHTKDKGAIMYPETADQTSRPADLRPPDREGLRYLGRDAGCLTTPPLPTS